MIRDSITPQPTIPSILLQPALFFLHCLSVKLALPSSVRSQNGKDCRFLNRSKKARCYDAKQTSTSHPLISRAQQIHFNAALVERMEFAAWTLKRGPMNGGLVKWGGGEYTKMYANFQGE